MKRLKFFLMSVMAMIAMGIGTTSCTKDLVEGIMGLDEYYFVIDEVSSNLLGTDGQDLTPAIAADIKLSNGQKNASLGKADAAPIDAFEKSCNSVKDAVQSAYDGKLPKGGWISIDFSLRKGSASGKVEMKRSVTIN